MCRLAPVLPIGNFKITVNVSSDYCTVDEKLVRYLMRQSIELST